MAGGTSAFDMIQSGKNNRNLRTQRRKMSDNPYAKPSKNSIRKPSNYKEMIGEREYRKSYQGKITTSIYLFVFITMALLIFIALVM